MGMWAVVVRVTDVREGVFVCVFGSRCIYSLCTCVYFYSLLCMLVYRCVIDTSVWSHIGLCG